MHVLHVGTGFRPYRHGGLVAYAEDLMHEQLRRGHAVSYFFSGRHYPYVSGPRLKRWARGDLRMLEVVNSPLHDHGRQPELELDEPRIERMLDRALAELRPDVVHVQELAGLPSSLLDVAAAAGIPTVVTLQDYFPLCSTFKLLDADGRVCLRRDIGLDCVRKVSTDPSAARLLADATLRYDLVRLLRLSDPTRRHPWVEGVARALARGQRPAPPATAEAFQRRREVNVERLNRAGRVIAMSHRVAEIYAQLGVDPDRIETRQLTLAHIERLTPRAPRPGSPLTFATMNGLSSEAKGARLVVDAVDRAAAAAPPGSFRVLAFGFVADAVAERARRLPELELRGFYWPEEVDRMLDEVDVGIVPSIWEEAYAYVGMEFLAKGIPVIANAIGGMVDYTREGETGWLNRSLSADELAATMLDIVERPEQIRELSSRVRRGRDELVKPLAVHADEMDELYARLTS